MDDNSHRHVTEMDPKVIAKNFWRFVAAEIVQLECRQDSGALTAKERHDLDWLGGLVERFSPDSPTKMLNKVLAEHKGGV